MKEEVKPLERFERLELILVDSLHQERHYDIRQLLRLFMRDVMTCAFHGLDLGVGEKLYPRATHGLHEITFSAVNEYNRTFHAADKRLDLALRHHRRRPVTKNRIVL